MATYYTVAWFDRWLKKPGETGYADADARLPNDNGVQGRNEISYHFHSARGIPIAMARCTSAPTSAAAAPTRA